MDVQRLHIDILLKYDGDGIYLFSIFFHYSYIHIRTSVKKVSRPVLALFPHPLVLERPFRGCKTT